MRLAAIIVVCQLVAGNALAGERRVYAPTKGPKCIDRSREYQDAWSCAGPAGYVAEFSDEGNLAAVYIQPPGRREAATAYVFPGRGRVFGDVVEWRVVDDEPMAAVLRIWRSAPPHDGAEGEVSELVVFKITPRTSCRVASVDARRLAANETARRLASETAAMPCNDME